MTRLSINGKFNSGTMNDYSQLHITNPEKENICTTCGTRYSMEKHNENICAICRDDRQYVPSSGQEWISYDALLDNHSIRLKKHNEQLYEFKILPSFAISQRAFFIKSDFGNILWDCIPLITEPIMDFIQKNGGIKAIVISHPHYYSLMNEWAKAFQCPIYIHEADREWVMDTAENIEFWKGNEYKLTKDATIIHTGGHFSGSAVLHHELNPLGKALFLGDSLYLSRDKRHLSAMYSYPNLIPLTNSETLAVFDIIRKYKFDALFGAFDHQDVYEGGREIFETSFSKYDFNFKN